MEPRGYFAKRAGKVLQTVFKQASGETFTDLSTILPDEAPEDIARVTRILSDMGYAEVNSQGLVRLTEDGVKHAETIA